MSTALSAPQSSAINAAQPITPMELIAQASASDASIERMQQLFDLQMRWEAKEARKAFNEAMAHFKANAPTIAKNKHVTHNDFWHATLDECVSKITPALADVGIRHRWDIDQSKAPSITVTCILSHQMGYSESTPLTASADGSGSKNAIQAIGSAVTYLQRYTLLSATGLAAGGTDNDGSAVGATKPGMAEPALVSHLDKIMACASDETLKACYKAAYGEATAIGDKNAQADIIKAKNLRYKEIHAEDAK